MWIIKQQGLESVKNVFMYDLSSHLNTCQQQVRFIKYLNCCTLPCLYIPNPRFCRGIVHNCLSSISRFKSVLSWMSTLWIRDFFFVFFYFIIFFFKEKKDVCLESHQNIFYFIMFPLSSQLVQQSYIFTHNYFCTIYFVLLLQTHFFLGKRNFQVFVE